MTGKSQLGQVMIRSSHEDLSDPTSHLLMPTAEQGAFPPFDRFAETVATRRIQVGLHPHWRRRSSPTCSTDMFTTKTGAARTRCFPRDPSSWSRPTMRYVTNSRCSRPRKAEAPGG